MNEPFTWPRYPQSKEDFDALMLAADAAMSDRGLDPPQRPMHLPHLFWEAFEWGGDVFPLSSLAESAGYEGDVLMAKAQRWYRGNYGEKLTSDMVIGFVPVRIGNATWRVRLGVIYGAVQIFVDRNLQNGGVTLGSRGAAATFNSLCAVEDLPQGLVDNIDEAEICQFYQFFLYAHENIRWHSELHSSELFEVARNDYAASTADLLAGRYAHSRWSTQQAVEKTIKGMLTLAGTNFPTSGQRGHNLKHLGNLLEQDHGIRIQPSYLNFAECSPKVRYGEEPSSDGQAMTANHAFLKVVNDIRTSLQIAKIIG